MLETSKAKTVNPKDLLGSQKVSITKLPPVAMLHASHAMMDGAKKYGAYNWRDKDVIASIYLDACLRHMLAWSDGEEFAQDSGVHHLGHAIACMAILLDAQASSSLIDDRPISADKREICSRVMSEINAKIKAKTESQGA